jgi:hypothetical protein
MNTDLGDQHLKTGRPGLVRTYRFGISLVPLSRVPSHRFPVVAQTFGLTLDEISVELARLPQDHPEEEDWLKLFTGTDRRYPAGVAQPERMTNGEESN